MSTEPAPTPEPDETTPALLAAALRDAEQQARELAAVARRQTEIADELHAENRRLREGEVREAVAPIVRGLARLSDELAVIRAGCGGGDPTAADLAHIEQRVTELLHDAGVTPLDPAPGDPFDVRLHTAAGSISTEDPLEDQTIVGVRRPGLLRDDGRLVRPAEVLVHRFATRPDANPKPNRTAE